MDKDRVSGSAKKVIGMATGDAKLTSEGAAEEIEGKVPNSYGGFRDVLKK